MYLTTEIGDDVADKLPTPCGYQLLIAMPKANKQTGGGVYLPDKHVDAESTASIIGLVVDMGPDAYKDNAKFPCGPYCEAGNFVVFRSYSGTRFKIKEQEFRLINDDTVQAVVADPSHYSRV